MSETDIKKEPKSVFIRGLTSLEIKDLQNQKKAFKSGNLAHLIVEYQYIGQKLIPFLGKAEKKLDEWGYKVDEKAGVFDMIMKPDEKCSRLERVLKITLLKTFYRNIPFEDLFIEASQELKKIEEEEKHADRP